MPVKWTPDIDQLLLLKILETHDLRVDAKKVVDAWPKDKGEAPTERAIKERLVKIRQNSKDSGSQNSPASSAQSKSAGTPKDSPTKTTASGIRKKPVSNGASAGSPTKRRKLDATSDDRKPVKPEPPSEDEDDLTLLSAGPVTPNHSKSFMPTNTSLGNSFDNSFGNGSGVAHLRNGWGEGGESYANYGYDGACDFYDGSFNDEVAV